MKLPSEEQLAAAEKLAYVEPDIVRAALVNVPPSWARIETEPNGGYFRRGSLQVGFTVARYDDGRIWLHASVCGRTGPDRFHLPDWNDVKRVKQDFLGDRWAYVVLPPESRYVNQNPYVLHLYALLDRNAPPALPDFTWGLGSL